VGGVGHWPWLHFRVHKVGAYY